MQGNESTVKPITDLHGQGDGGKMPTPPHNTYLFEVMLKSTSQCRDLPLDLPVW